MALEKIEKAAMEAEAAGDVRARRDFLLDL